MSKKVIIDHALEYLLLVVVLLVSFLVLKFIPDIAWKVIIIFSLAAFYFGYGSFHHAEEKNLKISTVLEYGLVATIIVITLVILFS